MPHDFLAPEFKTPRHTRDLNFQERKHHVGNDHLSHQSNPERQSANRKQPGLKNFQACLQCQQGVNSNPVHFNVKQPQEGEPDQEMEPEILDAVDSEPSGFWPSIFEYLNQPTAPLSSKTTLDVVEESPESDFNKRAQIAAETEATAMESDFQIDPPASGLSEPLPETDSLRKITLDAVEKSPESDINKRAQIAAETKSTAVESGFQIDPLATGLPEPLPETDSLQQEVPAYSENQQPRQYHYGNYGPLHNSAEGQFQFHEDATSEVKLINSQGDESDESRLSKLSGDEVSTNAADQAPFSRGRFSQDESDENRLSKLSGDEVSTNAPDQAPLSGGRSSQDESGGSRDRQAESSDAATDTSSQNRSSVDRNTPFSNAINAAINAASNDTAVASSAGKPLASIKFEASPIFTQIVDNLAMDRVAMTATRDREIQIQLHPVELGRLMVVINSAEEQIKATIIASELVTSELLNREKEHLIAALKEQGIDLPDVNISHRDPRDASRNSSNDSESSFVFQRKRMLADSGSKTTNSASLGDAGHFDAANQIIRINLIA